MPQWEAVDVQLHCWCGEGLLLVAEYTITPGGHMLRAATRPGRKRQYFNMLFCGRPEMPLE